MLDPIKIAVATANIIHSRPGNWSTIPSLSKMHCLNSLQSIANKDVVGDKAHRLIGWVQAACSFAEVCTMEEFRDINRICESNLRHQFQKDTVKLNRQLMASKEFIDTLGLSDLNKDVITRQIDESKNRISELMSIIMMMEATIEQK